VQRVQVGLVYGAQIQAIGHQVAKTAHLAHRLIAGSRPVRAAPRRHR
jgi:hypothetical protein